MWLRECRRSSVRTIRKTSAETARRESHTAACGSASETRPEFRATAPAANAQPECSCDLLRSARQLEECLFQASAGDFQITERCITLEQMPRDTLGCRCHDFHTVAIHSDAGYFAERAYGICRNAGDTSNPTQ